MSQSGIRGRAGGQGNADSAALALQWRSAARIPDGSKSPFYGVSKEQLALLKDRIGRANGTVIILVHPWYEEIPPGSLREETEKFARYQDIATDLLVGGRRPIVILEECYRLASTERRLRAMGASNYLLIPTEGGRSVPFLEDSVLRKRDIDYTKRFGELYDALMEAGARTILIAGMLSMKEAGFNRLSIDEYERKWLGNKANPPNRKDHELLGCVGFLYWALISNALEKTQMGQKPPAIRIIPRGVYPDPPWYAAERDALEESRNEGLLYAVTKR
jgi:hypothetical protein